MTAATSPARKRHALMVLAFGRPQSQAAAAAGVAPCTVSAWCRDPVFAQLLDELRVVAAQRPLDSDVLMARMEAAERRLTPPGRSRPARVRAVIPAGASPKQRRQIVARAVARSVAAVVEDAL